MTKIETQPLIKYISFLLVTFALAACGGGGGSKNKTNSSQPLTSSSNTISSANSSSSSNSSSSLASLAPTAEILFPPQNAFTEGSTILVRGTASDTDGTITNVSVNGVKATSTDGFATWSVKLPTQVGTHTLDVTVVDNTGVTNQTPIQEKITHQAAQIRQASKMAFDKKNNRALVLDDSYNDSLSPAIIAVDLDTGAQTIFSDNTKAEIKFKYPWGITIDDEGNRALIIDDEGLIGVDLTTGKRTIINLGTLPGSTDKLPIQALFFDNTDNRLWASSGSGTIFYVDLATGTPTILEDSVTSNAPIQISYPYAMQVDSENQLLIIATISESFRGIVSVDMKTGDRSIISDRNTPNARNMLSLPTQMNLAIDANNNRIYSTDFFTLFEINSLNGERTPIPTAPSPTSFISRPIDIFIDSQKNRLIVLDSEINSLIAVDLATKHESILSEILTNSLGNTLNDEQTIFYDSKNDKIFSANYTSILSVDAFTGERAVFKKFRGGSSGYDALTYSSATDTLYYSERFEGSIETINLASQKTTVVTGAGIPNFINVPLNYSAIEVDENKNLLIVADSGSAAIYGVDPLTGERNIISDNKTPNANNPMSYPTSIEFDAVNNRLFVIDYYLKSVYQINMNSGERILLTSPTIPNSKIALQSPRAITYDSAMNRVLVIDSELRALVGIDISTGERSIISSSVIPDSTNPIGWTNSLHLSKDKNAAYFLDTSSKKLISVELSTGQRTILCSVPGDPEHFVIDLKNNRAVISSKYSNELYIYAFEQNTILKYERNTSLGDTGFLENDHVNDRIIAVDGKKVVTVDKNDGSTKSLYDGSMNFLSLSEISFDSQSQKLFSLDYDEKLHSTDLNTGSSELLFTFRNNYSMTEDISYVTDIAFGSEPSSLFIASRNSKNQNDLWRFNPSEKSLSIVFNDKTPVLNDWEGGSLYVALNDAKNLAYLVDDGRGSVTEVNLTDGSHKILSDKVTPNIFNPILEATSMTLDTKRNRLLISQYYVPGLLSIDLETGERVYVSR